jgi:hypothetical protein
MEPIFTIPYAEFAVAQRLQQLLPASRGFAVYVPASRQQPAVDLILARRRQGHTAAATIQVKSSRTYSPPTNRVGTATRFRYRTWFNTFECPNEADFFCLVALYPAIDVRQRRELGTWWAPQIMLFSQGEMRKFLAGVETVGGKADKMFGFGFDEPGEAYQTRGDRQRRFREFSGHLLERRVEALVSFLDEYPALSNKSGAPCRPTIFDDEAGRGCLKGRANHG